MHNAKEAAQLVKTRQKTVAVTEAARVKRLAGNVVTNRKELEHLQSDASKKAGFDGSYSSKALCLKAPLVSCCYQPRGAGPSLRTMPSQSQVMLDCSCEMISRARVERFHLTWIF